MTGDGRRSMGDGPRTLGKLRARMISTAAPPLPLLWVLNGSHRRDDGRHHRRRPPAHSLAALLTVPPHERLLLARPAMPSVPAHHPPSPRSSVRLPSSLGIVSSRPARRLLAHADVAPTPVSPVRSTLSGRRAALGPSCRASGRAPTKLPKAKLDEGLLSIPTYQPARLPSSIASSSSHATLATLAPLAQQ